MRQLQKRKLTISFLATISFYLLAHGYRCFHNLFSGDSLIEIFQDDYAWQIALGRCFNPVWVFFRGTLTAPWLISFVGIFWLSLAVYCVADYLKIENGGAICLLAAVMTMNGVLTSLNAAFLPWVDLQLFSLFLNVAGVWFLDGEKKIRFLPGIICLTLGLGTYQAYLTVAVSLVMLRFLVDFAENSADERFFAKKLKLTGQYGLSFLTAGILYYGCWKMIQNRLGIWTADTYNGLSKLGSFSATSLWQLAAGAYRKVFLFFWEPQVFVSLYFGGKTLAFLWIWLLRVIHLILLMLVIGKIIVRDREKKVSPSRMVCQGILLFLLPLGMNFVFILSGGMEHSLMIYSFLLFYVLTIRLLFDISVDTLSRDALKIAHSCRWRAVGILCLIVVCWVNTVYANQVYLKKELQEASAISLMTRIVRDVESQEGYHPGETQVAFAGRMTDSSEVKDPDGFADIMPYGMSNTLLFYSGTEEAFLKYYLHSGMLVTEIDSAREEVKRMPVYPKKGSIAFIDGVLTVKISD